MKMSDVLAGGGGGRTTRIFVTVLLTATLIYTITLNGLAGPGVGPFKQSTGNVSDKFFTCITPAGFTFSIWSIIYISLVLIIIYAITLLFRKVEDEPAWGAGGAISAFMLTLFVNLNLNVGWLSDKDCFARAASSLLTKSKLDFWCGILSINGMGFYVTWTILAALLNLTIFFKYEIELDGNGICLGVLIFLLVVLIAWFILENSLLRMFSNPLVTHYAVVIWAMAGMHSKQKNIASGEVVALIITNMTAAAVMLVARIGFLIYRNRINKLYCEPAIEDTRVKPVKY
ncbi:uncharacterized protein [Macrobrachium rosenbergii]|uniref:uncharacterized protein n=1 Tax=Macrobrachium rosenbergii TaxID=79674 RepID=UPI0034D50EFD